jgi:hypothetical protein
VDVTGRRGMFGHDDVFVELGVKSWVEVQAENRTEVQRRARPGQRP